MRAISDIAVYWAVNDGVPIDAWIEWFDYRVGMCWSPHGPGLFAELERVGRLAEVSVDPYAPD